MPPNLFSDSRGDQHVNRSSHPTFPNLPVPHKLHKYFLICPSKYVKRQFWSFEIPFEWYLSSIAWLVVYDWLEVCRLDLSWSKDVPCHPLKNKINCLLWNSSMKNQYYNHELSPKKMLQSLCHPPAHSVTYCWFWLIFEINFLICKGRP